MNANTIAKVIAGLLLCNSLRPTQVSADPGDLDPSFGSQGMTRTRIEGFSEAVSMVIQGDGKILVAGTAEYSNEDFALVRYNSDGSADTTFGIAGKVTTPIKGRSDFGRSVAVQGDGKIVVAGDTYVGYVDGWDSDYDFAVVRYNANGSLDASFGLGEGKVSLDCGFYNRAHSVAITTDGKILVAGADISCFLLYCLNADGSYDKTFDAYGSVRAEFGDYHNTSCANAMVIQRDGKILMAGQIQINGQQRMALARLLRTGATDPFFGGTGMITFNVGVYDNGANAVIEQSDGKLLVGGYSDSGSGQNFTLLRLNSFGMLDVTFGTGGVVVTDLGGSYEACTSLAVQTDGKIVAAGYTEGTNGMLKFALARYTDRGELDTGFGNQGKVTTAYTGQGKSVALQADGKILVAGGSDFLVARYIGPATPEIAVEQPDGTDLIDAGEEVNCGVAEVGAAPAIHTFTIRNVGTGTLTGLAIAKDGADSADFTVGPLATNIPMGASATFTVSFQPTGLGLHRATLHLASNDADENPFDIPLVGVGVPQVSITSDNPLPSGTVGSPYSMTLSTGGGAAPLTWSVVAGVLPAGLTLSSDGVISGTPATAANVHFTVGVRSAGNASSATKEFDFRVLGPLAPGALDIGFGNGGRLITTLGAGEARANSMAIQTDGRIILAGSSDNGFNLDFAVVRYLPDGTLDTSFGNMGVVTTPFGSGNDEAYSVAVQGDGKIVAAGYAHNGNNYDYAVARYEADGRLDASFGSEGKVTTAIGNLHDLGQSVAVQTDGNIVVAGYYYNGIDNDFAVVRYQSDGRLDTSFGADGRVKTPIGLYDDSARSVALQRDGKIVVVGSSRKANDDDIALVRYNSDGTLDANFGTGGKVTTAIGSFNDFGYSVVLQGDGKLVVGGFTSTGSDSDFALLRYGINGNLDASFGSGGIAVTPVGNFGDFGLSAALQSDGKILLAGYSVQSGNFNFALTADSS